jgi:phosphoglycerate dehydrogenase-like enzyme
MTHGETAHGVVVAEEPLPGPSFADLERVEVAQMALHDYIGQTREDVEALISFHSEIDDKLLRRLPRLRVVARFGIGYDNVDVDACSRRGIQVAITPGPVETATAELTVALMLAATRGLVTSDSQLRKGVWPRDDTHLPPETGLAGVTVGLIGFGKIAQGVAARLAPFESNILFTTPSQHRTDARWRELSDLLTASDVLSIHCPLTPTTRHLIGSGELARLRDGALVVNAARAGIVDTDALVAELVTGRLSAALDVFDDEPTIPPRLTSLPNVLLSPHAGSATRGARVEMTRLCVENVRAALAGELAQHRVPEQADFTPIALSEGDR